VNMGTFFLSLSLSLSLSLFVVLAFILLLLISAIYRTVLLWRPNASMCFLSVYFSYKQKHYYKYILIYSLSVCVLVCLI
jgi:hypothetical protein